MPRSEALFEDDSAEEQVPKKRIRRAQVLSDDEDSEPQEQLPPAEKLRQSGPPSRSAKTTNKASKSKSRPKARDLEPEHQAVVATAIEIYRALLLSEHAYPSADDERDWAKGAWTLACAHHNESIPITADIIYIVREICLLACITNWAGRYHYAGLNSVDSSRPGHVRAYPSCSALKSAPVRQ
jgi:hypothetical protein